MTQENFRSHQQQWEKVPEGLQSQEQSIIQVCMVEQTPASVTEI